MEFLRSVWEHLPWTRKPSTSDYLDVIRWLHGQANAATIQQELWTAQHVVRSLDTIRYDLLCLFGDGFVEVEIELSTIKDPSSSRYVPHYRLSQKGREPLAGVFHKKESVTCG